MAGYRVADVMRAVVQIVALRRAGFGNQYAPAWTGSGTIVDPADTEISGQVGDSKTGRGIADALVIALRPGVKVSEFIQRKQRDMVFTSVQTDSNGAFALPQQLPKGQAYGLVVVARGYRDLAIESGLRIPANAPERAQVNPIALQPD